MLDIAGLVLPESTRARPGHVGDVKTLFIERGYHNALIEAEKFFNYYTANGWVMGKGRAPCRDWKAAAAAWNTNAIQYAVERRDAQQNSTRNRDGNNSGWSGTRINVYNVEQ